LNQIMKGVVFDMLPTREYLEKMIRGTLPKPTCSNGHLPVEREIKFLKRSYLFICPVCGFGISGYLSPKDIEELKTIISDIKRKP